MKIGLISCTSIRYMPYLFLYKKIIVDSGNDYLIINEHELEEKLEEKHITFTYNGKGKLSGVRRYLNWRRFVIESVKKNGIDKIVFLTPWAPIKLVDRCILPWSKKYILDIRDYSDESSSWFRKAEETVINHSIITVISSKGFLKWLPERNKYTVAHNMPANYVPHQTCECFKNPDINIAYIGLVGYYPQNCALADCTVNTRYRLTFSGAINASCPIEKYCSDHNYNHVSFTGVFNNSEKEKLYQGCDIINAVYGNDSEVVRHALPNKLYDALIYKIPIMAHKGTYLGEVIESAGVGFAVDASETDLLEQIEQYVASFDRDRFIDNCNNLLRQFENEQAQTEGIIRKALFY